jgi:two-component system, chemotaxis family, chemotaxis protein CheY
MQETMAQLISTIFDAETFVADSPISAFPIIGKQSIDLIILDFDMPGMNGKTALENIRRNKSKQELPVVMCTATKNQAVIADLMRLGINEFLVKPFEMNTAVAKLGKFLNPRVLE